MNLQERIYTGHAARDFLKDLLSSLSEEDAIVLRRVVLKDLRAGFS